MYAAVLEGSDAVIIGESSGVSAEKAPDFVGEDRKELDMIYQFEGIIVGYLPGRFKKIDPNGYRLAEFRDVYTRWDRALDGKGWNTLYLGNHDQPRMVSRWGDELGMTNIRFRRIGEYRDIETTRVYEQIRKKGGDTSGGMRRSGCWCC
jgi:oligo-1,6-glucosidase